MNATGLLDNGHLMIVQAVDNLNETAWDVPGACGNWSVKEVIAHLASYEHALIDALRTFHGAQPTRAMRRLVESSDEFNKEEVEKRRYDTAQHVLEEFNDAQVEASSLLAEIPAEKFSQTGTMPWYGSDHCLNDLIQIFYDHLCEHCGQIKAFRERKNM